MGFELDQDLTKERCVFSIRFTSDELEGIRTNRVDKSNDGSSQSRPVDPSIVLVGEDGQETETDDESTGDVSLVLLVFNVTNCGRGQEEEGKDDQDTNPDRGTVFFETSEGLEKVDDSRENDPSVPQRERSMDKDLFQPACSRIILCEFIYNTCYSLSSSSHHPTYRIHKKQRKP